MQYISMTHFTSQLPSLPTPPTAYAHILQGCIAEQLQTLLRHIDGEIEWGSNKFAILALELS